MESNSNKLVTITIGIIGVVWCLGMVVISVRHYPPYLFGGALTFGIIAAVLSVIYLIKFWNTPGRQAVEAGAVSIYYTIMYFAVAIIANTIFVLTENGGFNKYLIVFNLVIAAVYVILTIYAETYSKRVAGQLELTEQKTHNTAMISEKLGVLLSVVDDDEIKKKIMSLKESVDYSSNISSEKTNESEKLMEDCLDEVKDLIVKQSDKAMISNKIREAEIIWKTRTSAASSKR